MHWLFNYNNLSGEFAYSWFERNGERKINGEKKREREKKRQASKRTQAHFSMKNRGHTGRLHLSVLVES